MTKPTAKPKKKMVKVSRFTGAIISGDGHAETRQRAMGLTTQPPSKAPITLAKLKFMGEK
jgi:hypothetical protein